MKAEILILSAMIISALIVGFWIATGVMWVLERCN